MLTSAQSTEQEDDFLAREQEAEESRLEKMDELIEVVAQLREAFKLPAPKVDVTVEGPKVPPAAVHVTSAPATVNVPPSPLLKGLVVDITQRYPDRSIKQFTIKPIT